MERESSERVQVAAFDNRTSPTGRRSWRRLLLNLEEELELHLQQHAAVAENRARLQAQLDSATANNASLTIRHQERKRQAASALQAALNAARAELEQEKQRLQQLLQRSEPQRSQLQQQHANQLRNQAAAMQAAAAAPTELQAQLLPLRLLSPIKQAAAAAATAQEQAAPADAAAAVPAGRAPAPPPPPPRAPPPPPPKGALPAHPQLPHALGARPR
jgi:hypothetical protein